MKSLAALIAGLWLGWRWGREALVEEAAEMYPLDFEGGEGFSEAWIVHQREVADDQ